MSEDEMDGWHHKIWEMVRDRVDCSLPGSSVHGISQTRVLEWGAIAFSGYYLLVLTNKDK